MVFNLVVGAIVLVLGSLAAVWWWRLAQKIAPYRDEVNARPQSPDEQEGEVIVINSPGGTDKRDLGHKRT